MTVPTFTESGAAVGTTAPEAGARHPGRAAVEPEGSASPSGSRGPYADEPPRLPYGCETWDEVRREDRLWESGL